MTRGIVSAVAVAGVAASSFDPASSLLRVERPIAARSERVVSRIGFLSCTR